MPITPDAALWGRQWEEIKTIARTAGRDPAALTGSMYLTIFLDDDPARANVRLNDYLERYYGVPAEQTRRRQAGYAGPASGLAEWPYPPVWKKGPVPSP